MGAQVSIGDFAVMTSLSRKALRHYHDIGILEPAHIDAHTGYRFYDTSQVDHAHIIRRFRSLGMSIPDIKALLSTDDAGACTEIITTHLEQMEAQLQQTRDTIGALRELLTPVHTPAHVELRQEPPLAVWSIGDIIETAEIDSWFAASLRKLRDAVATAASAHSEVVPGGLYDRALFFESRGEATLFGAAPQSAEPPEGIRAEVLPQAEYAVLTHDGGRSAIDRSDAALGVFANGI
jgi:DNA-binding transcriptional MerR regulator